MKIAIVGTGISGNAAAWLLNGRHDITVYEKDSRIGGHANTVSIDYQGTPVAVDTGFIVYNTLNYPNLTALFDHLKVPTVESDMSFSLSTADGALEWSGQSLNTVFAQRRNLFRPRFHAMWTDILRFNKVARRELAAGTIGKECLADYLKERNFSKAFRDFYLLPMGAAIWSTPREEMLNFPAESFIRFFDNHRLMHAKAERPKWRTVEGGSQTYVRILHDTFGEKVRLGAGVETIKREGGKVIIKDTTGSVESYDHVVIAAHSDEALSMLSDASAAERSILGDIQYRPNIAYLHRDTALMPRRMLVWSSWNYRMPSIKKCDSDNPVPTDVSVSYWMNSLQNIPAQMPLFVSLNPEEAPRDDLIFGEFSYDHPQFNQAALIAQRRLPMIQGVRNTWFCGAWTGYGFHEDGLRSGLEVAEQLGAYAPWRRMPVADAHHHAEPSIPGVAA